MPLEDVKLIEKDVMAQRLVSAWPHLKEREDQEKQYIEWSRMAQVPLMDVYRLGAMLKQTGICNADGTIDEAARIFLAAGPGKTIKSAQSTRKPTPPSRKPRS
jgi:hypothetical protein